MTFAFLTTAGRILCLWV